MVETAGWLEPITGNEQKQVFSYDLVNGRCCYCLFIIIPALPLMPCFVVLDMSCNSSVRIPYIRKCDH